MTRNHTSGGCLFCGIAADRVPAHTVFENRHLVAFLDIRPIRPGHVQVIPRAHFDCFDELPPALATEILLLGQRLAAVQKAAYGVRRVGFLFTGGDIPHVHAHLVPLVQGSDITSRRYIAEEQITFRDTPRVPDAELAETADSLRRALGP